MFPYLFAGLLGYLLGSSNMALYLAKLRGVDIRHGGSGNLGASNAMVLMGWGAGAVVAVHDIAKGVLAVILARLLFPGAAHIGLVAGSASVLGHIFPFYLKFRGGKGFATYLGMMGILHWKFALAILILSVAITLITDYITYATVTTVVSFPVFLIFTVGWVAAVIALVATAAVISRHGDNFRRIRSGTEIGLRRANRGDFRAKK